MTRPRKILSFAILVAFLTSVAWIVYHETRVPQSETEVNNRVFELEKEGRYDTALQVVRKWMTDSRREPAHDDSFFQEIAMIYFMQAYKNPTSRDESIQQSALNLEKALDAFDQKKPEGVQIELYEIGRTYEELGKLSTRNQCQYYERAKQSYVKQLPMIEGESFTAYGHTTPLKPVRAEVTKHLNAVELKLSQAGCQADPEKQQQ